MIQEIKTLDDVIQFAKQLVNDESLNFHPDDDFKDYINKNGNPSYTPEEAEFRNKLMEKCFEVCESEGKDVYDIMGDVFLIETGLVKFIPLSTSPLHDEIAAVPAYHLKGARLLSYKEIKDKFNQDFNH